MSELLFNLPGIILVLLIFFALSKYKKYKAIFYMGIIASSIGIVMTIGDIFFSYLPMATDSGMISDILFLAIGIALIIYGRQNIASVAHPDSSQKILNLSPLKKFFLIIGISVILLIIIGSIMILFMMNSITNNYGA